MILIAIPGCCSQGKCPIGRVTTSALGIRAALVALSDGGIGPVVPARNIVGFDTVVRPSRSVPLDIVLVDRGPDPGAASGPNLAPPAPPGTSDSAPPTPDSGTQLVRTGGPGSETRAAPECVIPPLPLQDQD